jgi:hypothetical protein
VDETAVACFFGAIVGVGFLDPAWAGPASARCLGPAIVGLVVGLYVVERPSRSQGAVPREFHGKPLAASKELGRRCGTRRQAWPHDGMTSAVASILWRRLDAPGHDACRLEGEESGWRLTGTAVFLENGVPAQLSYHLACDPAWRTQEGQVRGWVGAQVVDVSIVRTATGVWMLDGAVVPGVANCVDLDLGFTPATNAFQLRRLALSEGQAADVPVAWFDVSAAGLEVLHQRYERRGETTYWYEAPRFDYAALLEVTPAGFITLYPGLWEAER